LLMGSGEIINLEIITGYLQEWEWKYNTANLRLFIRRNFNETGGTHFF
jgi:hypothetical protein